MIKYLVSNDDDTVIVEGKDKLEVIVKIIEYFKLENNIQYFLEENDFVIREFSDHKSL